MSSTNQKCRDCDSYAKEGHNYCRMCGYHLTKGHIQNNRLWVGYHINEKYCGYCGKLRIDCKC